MSAPANLQTDWEPHSIEAEEAFLGSLLIAKEEIIDEVIPPVRPADFYIAKNRWVYEAILALRERGEPVDPITVDAELERRGQLNEIGGPAFTAHLINVPPSAFHARGYAQVLERLALRRRLLKMSNDLAAGAYDADRDHGALIVETLASLNSVGRNRNGHCSSWTDMAKIIGPIKWTWRLWIPIGLLTLIVSDAVMGISTVMLRCATSFTRGDGLPDGSPYTGEVGKVLWCDTEAAEAINLTRAKAWSLPLDSIVTPFADPLQEVCLDDFNHRSAVAAVAHRPDLRAIFVDSLSGSSRRNENASDEMFELAKWLAQLARDTGKPVIVAHHLKKRTLLDGESVTLERVRGSTSIVQPARVVWALDTPDPAHLDVKRLSVIKSNLGTYPEPIGLTIGDLGVSFCSAPEAPREETQRERIADLLLDLLADGPVTAEKIQREIEQAGLSWHACKHVKGQLRIVSTKPGGIWHWGLPARD